MKQAVNATNVVRFMRNVTHSALKEHGTHKSTDYCHGLKESSRGELRSKISTSPFVDVTFPLVETHTVFFTLHFIPIINQIHLTKLISS